MTRQVRITLEGDATNVVDSHGHPTGCLRVRYAPARGELPAASVFVDTRAESVTVEDVTPERVWTDGDVVQHVPTGQAFVRGEAAWPADCDTEVDEGVGDGEYRVLRHQAGDR